MQIFFQFVYQFYATNLHSITIFKDLTSDIFRWYQLYHFSRYLNPLSYCNQNKIMSSIKPFCKQPIKQELTKAMNVSHVPIKTKSLKRENVDCSIFWKARV